MLPVNNSAEFFVGMACLVGNGGRGHPFCMCVLNEFQFIKITRNVVYKQDESYPGKYSNDLSLSGSQVEQLCIVF